MNRRRTLVLSLLANVALTAALIWLARPAAPSLPAPRAASPAPPDAASRPVPAPAATGATADPAEPRAAFRWSELASTDFVVYRDRLRAIGCPEKTVRDILESEIAQDFAVRRRPLIEAVQPHFWNAFADQGDQALESWNDSLRAVKNEQAELLARVLGQPPEDLAAERRQRRQQAEETYDWAPPETRSRLVDLEEQLWQQERALQAEIAQRESPAWTEADHARRRQFREEHQRVRREVLGEWAGEFELRQSSHAAWAQGLAGFEPTESEWRAVAEALGRGAASPEEVLSPERRAEFQQASDPAYRQTRRVTRRLGLSDDLAVQAVEIQRGALAAAAELRANPELGAARRQAGLQAVAGEAARSLRAVLGETGWAAYEPHAGQWWRSLSPDPHGVKH